VALASYHFNGSDMPAPAAGDFSFGGTIQPLLELVPLRTQPVDAGEHSLQQGFGRRRGDARALELADIRTRAYDLWRRAGEPENRDEEFWLLAEQELRNEDKSSPLRTPDNL
jgi:hypothetical protein